MLNKDDILLARKDPHRVCTFIASERGPAASYRHIHPPVQRLLSHIEMGSLDPEVCWPWKLGVSSSGRPKITTEGGSASVSVARVLWLLFIDDLPGGIHPSRDWDVQLVRQSCKNGICLRPSHFYLATKREIASETMKRLARGQRYDRRGLHFERNQQQPIHHVHAYRQHLAQCIVQLRQSGSRVKDIAAQLHARLSFVEKVLNGTLHAEPQSDGGILPHRLYTRRGRQRARGVYEVPG